MTQNQVTIRTSPELIKLLGQRLYSSSLDVILARELLQNAFDASAHDPEAPPVELTDSRTASEYGITVADYGTGMTRDTLLDKFLVIGESGKANDANSTGGFGIAKVALFCTDYWQVHTLGLVIDSLTLTLDRCPTRKGTEVHARTTLKYGTYTSPQYYIVLHGNRRALVVNDHLRHPYEPERLLSEHKTASGIPYTLSLAPAIDTPSARLSGYVIYRIKGLVQYASKVSSELATQGKNLLVDFDTITTRPQSSDYPFELSRESVKPEVAEVVAAFVEKLAKDTTSTLKEDSPIVEWLNDRTGLLSHSANGTRYNPTTVERRVARLWRDVCELVLPYGDFTHAVSNDPTHYAYYQGKSDVAPGEVLGINAHLFLEQFKEVIQLGDTLSPILGLWHTACHEVAHRYSSYHDERFTIEESSLATASATRISANTDRLRKSVRKLFND